MHGVFETIFSLIVDHRGSLDELPENAVRQVLFGGMSRVGFVRALLQTKDLSSLPVGHLFDQRVVLPPIRFPDGSTEEEVHDLILGRLHSMIDVSDNSGARKLITSALEINPTDDAGRLMRLRGLDLQLFNLCVRGNFHRVNNMIGFLRREKKWDINTRNTVAKMIIYHCCMQLQIICASFSCMDVSEDRLCPGSGQLTKGQFDKNIKVASDTMSLCLAHLNSGDSNFVPDPDIQQFVDMAREAEKLVEDKEALLDSIKEFFQNNKILVKELQELASSNFESYDRSSFVKLIYGVSRKRALIFACARLIALQKHMKAVLGSPVVKGGLRQMVVFKSLPAFTDRNVIKLVFAYEKIFDRGSDTEADDIALAWKKATVDGDPPGLFTMRNDVRRQMKKGEPGFRRPTIKSRDHSPLVGAQRFDCLPDFLIAPRMQLKSAPARTAPAKRSKKAHATKAPNRPKQRHRFRPIDSVGKAVKTGR